MRVYVYAIRVSPTIFILFTYNGIFSKDVKLEQMKNFLQNNPVTKDPSYLCQLRSFALSEGGLINGNAFLSINLFELRINVLTLILI